MQRCATFCVVALAFLAIAAQNGHAGDEELAPLQEAQAQLTAAQERLTRAEQRVAALDARLAEAREKAKPTLERARRAQARYEEAQADVEARKDAAVEEGRERQDDLEASYTSSMEEWRSDVVTGVALATLCALLAGGVLFWFAFLTSGLVARLHYAPLQKRLLAVAALALIPIMVGAGLGGSSSQLGLWAAGFLIGLGIAAALLLPVALWRAAVLSGRASPIRVRFPGLLSRSTALRTGFSAVAALAALGFLIVATVSEQPAEPERFNHLALASEIEERHSDELEQLAAEARRHRAPARKLQALLARLEEDRGAAQRQVGRAASQVKRSEAAVVRWERALAKPDPAERVRSEPTPGSEPDSGSNCDPNYSGACLDSNASDYDCAGGSGHGPEYVSGPIRVVGSDPHGLDSDGDGVACE